MKKKVLMYRWSGDNEWKEYKDDASIMELDDYIIGNIYTVEYKVIKKEKINV